MRFIISTQPSSNLKLLIPNFQGVIYANHKPHQSLPALWRPTHRALVWQGHYFRQTVQARRSGVRLWGGTRDARHGRARRDVRSAERQNPGELVLRAFDAYLVIIYRRDGAIGWIGHPY